MLTNRFIFALLLASTACAAVPAKAAMVFCNRTSGVIEAAVGYRETQDWISEGWWRIEPGQCARVFGKPLTQRFYFYYATSLTPPVKDKPPKTWAGKYEFCTDTKAFRIEGDENCETRNYHTQGFHEIDIGSNARDYSLDFREENGTR